MKGNMSVTSQAPILVDIHDKIFTQNVIHSWTLTLVLGIHVENTPEIIKESSTILHTIGNWIMTGRFIGPVKQYIWE